MPSANRSGRKRKQSLQGWRLADENEKACKSQLLTPLRLAVDNGADDFKANHLEQDALH